MIALAAGLTVALTTKVFGQPTPGEIIKMRIEAYRETGASFKNINDQLRRDAPPKILLRHAARQIVKTSHNQYDWFPKGTGPEAGVKTGARPAIWSDQETFRTAQGRFKREAATMLEVVEGGDVAAMRRQARTLGQACKACHDKFRLDD